MKFEKRGNIALILEVNEMLKGTASIQTVFGEPAGDTTKTRMFLVGGSIEETLNGFSNEGNPRIRARKLSGHVSFMGYRATSNTVPFAVAKLCLVAIDPNSPPSAYSSTGFVAPHSCTGFEVHSVLADFKVSALYWQNVSPADLVMLRMDTMFSYKVPKNIKGLLESDEQLPEPNLRTQLAVWIYTPNGGWGFEPEDDVHVNGYLDIQYTSTQRTVSLAEV